VVRGRGSYDLNSYQGRHKVCKTLPPGKQTTDQTVDEHNQKNAQRGLSALRNVAQERQVHTPIKRQSQKPSSGRQGEERNSASRGRASQRGGEKKKKKNQFGRAEEKVGVGNENADGRKTAELAKAPRTCKDTRVGKKSRNTQHKSIQATKAKCP